MIFSVLITLISFFQPDYSSDVSTLLMVEICDNGLDDDGDGKIDINDPDCDCPQPEPISLIPNPSFEEMECCPGNRSQMTCAATWIQASSPTTDYIHTCGWMGWEDLPVPLPLPDGEGCVGFRDGRPGFTGTSFQADWKEYTGACLDFPLKAGESYKFQFYVGFTHSENSPPTNIVFYGSPSCGNLPFGPPEMSFGCPTNYAGWIELGRVFVSGVNTWNQYEINATPYTDIEAMVIGPGCEDVEASTSIYYFFDNLVLAEESKFGLEIGMDPASCSGNGRMFVPALDSLTYQWYLNGIALQGETSDEIKGDLEQGFYKVRLSGPNSCSITKEFNYFFDRNKYVHQVRICPGDAYNFNGLLLAENGVYLDTLTTIDNCDSIVEIVLSVDSDQTDTVSTKIFKGESIKVGNENFSEPGSYHVDLKSAIGCDSTVYLILDEYQVFIPNVFSPNDDGHNDEFRITGGDELISISHLQIFDRWGGVVFDGKDVGLDGNELYWDGKSQDNPVQTGIYIYIVEMLFDDGKERRVNGTLTLIR